MKDVLVGLYWYYKHNKRIVIPLTKGELKTLLAVANAWKHGAPEPIYFGSCLDFTTKDLVDCTNVKDSVASVLEDQYQQTAKHLSAYSLFPLGDKQLFELAGRYDCTTRIGWKQMFQWRPTCGS